MVSFAEAYHYMTGCPLRRLDDNPLPQTILGEWFRRYMSDLFVDMFIDRDYAELQRRFIDRMAEIEESSVVYDKSLKIRLFQSAAANATIFTEGHLESPAYPIGKFQYREMDAWADLYRVKENRTIELVWFMFDTVLPEMAEKDAYSIFCNWNARAFELKHQKRPYMLTLYYPFIGDSVKFTYNPDNGHDIIAGLVSSEVFYTNPGPHCAECKRCPEFVRYV